MLQTKTAKTSFCMINTSNQDNPQNFVLHKPQIWALCSQSMDYFIWVLPCTQIVKIINVSWLNDGPFWKQGAKKEDQTKSCLSGAIPATNALSTPCVYCNAQLIINASTIFNGCDTALFFLVSFGRTDFNPCTEYFFGCNPGIRCLDNPRIGHLSMLCTFRWV